MVLQRETNEEKFNNELHKMANDFILVTQVDYNSAHSQEEKN